MPAIRIDRFGGIAPARDRRNLPAGGAQIAENCRFDGGDLRPLRGDVSDSPMGNDLGNLFFYRRGDASRYIAFGRDLEVTAERSPTPDDTHQRYYWCIAGEGVFAIADPLNPSPAGVANSTGSGPGFRQFAGYRLGIPSPTNDPSASVQQDVASVGWGTSNAITAISNTNPGTFSTADPHGFEDGQRVRLRVDPGYDGSSAGGGGGGSTPPPDGESEPTSDWQNLNGREAIVAAVQSNQFDLTGINLASFATITSEQRASLSIERIIRDSDKEARSYLWTYVSQFGEEGPPSPASNVVDVLQDGTVSVSISDVEHNLATMGGARQNVDRIRVYRRVSGSQGGGTWLLVGDLGFSGATPTDGLTWASSPNNSNPAGAWQGQFVDSVPSVSLGEPLPSERWFPPPNGLRGIKMMPNGFLVGWKENTLYASEPYLPHAWNPDYSRTIEDDIVGCETFAATLVVGTRSRPYLVTGADPSALQVRKTELDAPLLSSRGIVDAGTGVLFCTADGLAWVSGGGARMLTQRLFDRGTWADVIQARPIGVFHDQRALFFGPGEQALLVDMNAGEPQFSIVTDLDMSAATPADRDLAIIVRQSGTYSLRQIFNASTVTNRTLRWRSGMFAMTKPCNLAVGQVYADSYPVTVQVRRIDPNSYPDPVAGQPDLDGFTVQTYNVQGPEPFRMQADYLSREFEIEIQSDTRVQYAVFSTSLDELRQLP